MELRSRSTHTTLRLLDTFFSDSLDDEVLEQMVGLCRDSHCEMRLLVLNPFSQFAIARAHALNTEPVREINHALFSLRNAIRVSRSERCLHIVRNAELLASPDFVLQQLSDLNAYRVKTGVSVKFYELLTEAPTYIIGEFVAKGLIVHGQTAAHNPWMILVDDMSQKNDIYDLLSSNFNTIWDEGSDWLPAERLERLQPGSDKNIFVSHGHNHNIKARLCMLVRKRLRLNPILFEKKSKQGRTVIENLERITATCSSALILMTKEDQQSTGGMRARQNVIHELGYCQAKYGRERVILLLEEGVEAPSNISGILHTSFSGVAIEDCFDFIKDTFQP